ncbi:MAG TPA: N-formylglutamate amidohydrolase [Thermoanaerobaculia bacterium]|nr:N-formylglutamate amidohydrolase [Thermoanaerobaculia bacterium]
MGVPWSWELGEGAVVATAIHSGHELRPEVAARMALDDATRRREEDPFTDRWVAVAPTRLVVHRSRFEVDLNRPRDGAVYRRPADAWGLRVWRSPPPPELVASSLALWDAFHREARAVLAERIARHGRVVVLDLHAYNHRRHGAAGPAAQAAGNPTVNLGTGSLPRQRWARVVEACLAALRGAPLRGRPLDVAENVRFQGGHFPQWVHESFPGTACALALEVKKVFMDEWTGEADSAAIAELGAALAAAARAVEAASA